MVEIERRPARPVARRTAAGAEAKPAAAIDLSTLFAEESPRPIAVLDAEMVVRWANRAFRSLVGTDALGQPIAKWAPESPGFLDGLPPDRPAHRRMTFHGKDATMEAFRARDHAVGRWCVAVDDDPAAPRDMRDATARVSRAAQSVARSALGLSGSSEEILESMRRIAAGATEQAARVEETVRTAKDLASDVDRITASAGRAQAASAAANESAKAGQTAARTAIEQMSLLRQGVEDSARAVRYLADRSLQIGHIVATITGLAQQTNLLALNAAIEAARAGEHGRGFAVVADEVRKLAESSGKSADQIAVLIGQTTQDIHAVVETMRARTADVATSAGVVNEALRSLAAIGQATERTSDVVHEIGRATAAQREAAATISKAVTEVAGIAAETRASTGTTSAAVAELSANLEKLAATAQQLARTANELDSALTGSRP